jgi:uncharacterized membrane protein (DUF4010 family)
LGVALAVGLLIGIERGWQEREAEEGRRIAGVRTYGLIGLLGGIVALLAVRLGSSILGYAFIGLAIIFAAAYMANLQRLDDAGITSLIAGLLTFGFGALVVLEQITAAVAAAVVTALLLGVKPLLHRWLQQLTGQELQAALRLLLMSVVVLPILPNRGYGPWKALNPYELWWMVVLVAAIGFVGYFAMKIAGRTKGVVITGLFAGLISSTALTLQFARMARRQEDLAPLLASGILLACGTMFPRMLVLASIINPHLLEMLLLPAALMALLVYLPGLIGFWREARHAPRGDATMQNPLELTAALRFGVFLALLVILAAGLQETVGRLGLLLLAAVSGLTDVDAITLSLSRMSRGTLRAEIAVTGIILASAVNSAVKATIAGAIGGPVLGLRVALPLLSAASAGLVLVWLL